MSNSQGFGSSSRSPFAVVFGLIKGMVLGWLAFNILVILIGGYVVVRLWNIDTWPLRSELASRLTFHKFLDPAELIPENMAFSNLLLLDTDGDGEQERVMFYRYERAGGRSPVGVTILDLNSCRPRGIDSYELIPIDSDALSEYRYEVEIRDIPGVGGAHNVLIWGVTADGTRTELSIFHWFDYSDSCRRTSPDAMGYVNLGSFRGNGGIEIDGHRIRVQERAFERSHLALVHLYEPVEATYRQTIGGPMLPPVATAVEFSSEMPATATRSHYPEKTVLSFYRSVGIEQQTAREHLLPAAQATYLEGSYGRNVVEAGQLTSMAEVKEISYLPDIERERRHERVWVDVLLVNRLPDGTLTGPHRMRVWVVGVPQAGALPYDCEWLIESFEPLP